MYAMVGKGYIRVVEILQQLFFTGDDSHFNPLTARIFTVFGMFIIGQSVTQRSMGGDAPRYPPQYTGPQKGQIF